MLVTVPMELALDDFDDRLAVATSDVGGEAEEGDEVGGGRAMTYFVEGLTVRLCGGRAVHHAGRGHRDWLSRPLPAEGFQLGGPAIGRAC